MKIVTVVGARPQFIKAGAVSRTIESFNIKKNKIQEILVHTGQHYDYLMDRVFFEELEIPQPNYHLGVGSGSHGKQTGMMLERIEAVLQKEKPEMVLVYGDTNSTLAGALAAAKLNIPIAHVEAGLRSYVRSMPEEINRILTDHLSTFLFCPTSHAVQNLSKEGIKNGKEKIVKNVGDVMYDSILYYSKIAEKKSTILIDLGFISPQSEIPARPAGGRNPQYYLATLHRAENTDDPQKLKSIFKALHEIGKEIPVILPLHPRTRKMLSLHHLSKETRKVRIIQPVSYLNMLMLEKNARAILTDSGGVQKEAYWLGVPCITLREETEWIETVKSGWNILAGAETERIIKGVQQTMKKTLLQRKQNAFGDGKASEKIVDFLIKGR